MLKCRSLLNVLFFATYFCYIIYLTNSHYLKLLLLLLFNLGQVDLPKEDYGALIITTAAVVSFLTFLLCILCQRKRKRRHHRQLHRNAHYDSTTSATGEKLLNL